jgi:formylglycine-generating enzyme required for sulfatase activity
MSAAAWCRVVALAGLVGALVLVAPARTQAVAPKRYALLVGVGEYDHARLRDLRYAENDVEELGKLLKQGGYDEVVLLTSKRGRIVEAAQPTAANIRKQMKRLLAQVRKADVVLVALAGHGLQVRVTERGKEREECYFCPSDARPSDSRDYSELARTLLPLAEVFRALDTSGAGARLLLVDACRNEPGTSRNLDVDHLPRPARGTAALFACKSGEMAYETPKLGKGHGVFFHYVLEGLRGQAANEDNEVTWHKLTYHVQHHVMRQVPKLIGGGARQTPHLLANVEGDPVLLRAAPAIVRPKKEVQPKEQVRPSAPSRPKGVAVKLPGEITNSLGMKLVVIPAGKFLMGSPPGEKDRKDDEYLHEVEISRPFYIGAFEVTQAQYRQVMRGNPSYFCAAGRGKDRVKDLGTDDFPVESVSWVNAVEFCRRLSARPAERRAGRTYRLPTEAEWEYSCRAGTRDARPFHFGRWLSGSLANIDASEPYGGGKKWKTLGRTCPVGSYRKPNAWGLYDMHGNVSEWCSDWYDRNYYRIGSRKDPRGPRTGRTRVVRGGNWGNFARTCRSAARFDAEPASRSDGHGFRVVCVP